MPDYTRATGNAGTLIIRDNGTTVTFLIACGDGATSIGSPGATWSGQAAGARSGRFTWASGGGTRVIAGPFTVATSQTVSFGIGDTGTGGLGGPTAFSQAITRALPSAPSGLGVTRNSDTQHTLNWSRNATYTSVVVQRATDNGPWQQIGAPSGNAFTFTDTTTAAGKKYNYRVAGKTAAGQSVWSNVATVYTTPTVPTGVTAARSGDDIVVSASGRPAWVSSYDVRDGATVVATGVLLPWTHVTPNPATPHTYTVRAKVDSLTSAYSAPSNTVQLLAPPNPPTGLAPNGAVRAGDEDVRFAWVHNPVDSSVQSAYDLRYRAVGASVWTTLSGTTAAFRDVPLAEGAWEWQARTKGSHPDFSQWSSTATLSVIARPGVAVVQPDTQWDASALTVIWSWYQSQSRPQSAWQVELANVAGDVVESRSGTGASTSFALTHRLTEGDWTVRVRAATGEVWSEWASEAFEVVFVPPAPPELGGIWDESQGGVEVTVSASVAPDSPDTLAVLVERSVDGGETWERVVELEETAVLFDWESLSFGDVLYRATAVTAEGATATTEVIVQARSRALWLSGGERLRADRTAPVRSRRPDHRGAAAFAEAVRGKDTPSRLHGRSAVARRRGFRPCHRSRDRSRGDSERVGSDGTGSGRSVAVPVP